jgi:hypothetical protein
LGFRPTVSGFNANHFGNKKRAVKHDDALDALAGLAEMVELMLVLGWHNLQAHVSLSGHRIVVLGSGYACGFRK